MRKYFLYIILSLSFFSFSQREQKQETLIPEITVEEGNSSLHKENGVYYFDNSLFSGYIISKYENGNLKEKSGYVNGKKQGLSQTWFDNGTIQDERYYTNGEKDGIHRGWYENGSKRFEYSFKDGLNDGVSTEWYQSGEILKRIVYKNGTEENAKAWGINGKLYINYVVKNGVIYGMNNSNPCYSLKNEKGEYVSAK
jgi:antitoxin component YwqK of YwqJK toxin-antitoxin module